jgi:hypothetical protein
MANHSVLFFTDNEALVYVINKQSCKDKILMKFVRKLVLVCLQHNILFKAKHIPGTYNHLADLLSCFQIQTFQCETSASMNSCATDIPQALLPQNWEISFPSWRDPACSALRFLLINTLGNFSTTSIYIYPIVFPTHCLFHLILWHFPLHTCLIGGTPLQLSTPMSPLSGTHINFPIWLIQRKSFSLCKF